MTLNGYDLEEAKILHLGGKPINAPEGVCMCVYAVSGDDFKKEQERNERCSCRLPEQLEGPVQPSSHTHVSEKEPLHIFSSREDPGCP